MKEFAIKVWEKLKIPIVSQLPGQLAFFFIWSLVPFLTILGVITGFLNFSLDIIIDYIYEYMPSELIKIIHPLISGGDNSQSNIIILAITSLFLASKGASSIITTVNFLYQNDREDSFIKKQVHAIGITFILIISFVMLVFVMGLGNFIANYVYELLNINQGLGIFINVMSFILLMIFIYFSIYLVYSLAINFKINFKILHYGVLFTTVSWVIISLLFSVYIINFARFDLIYGSLSNIIIIMYLFYLFAYFFVIGIIINVVLYEEAGGNNYRV